MIGIVLVSHSQTLTRASCSLRGGWCGIVRSAAARTTPMNPLAPILSRCSIEAVYHDNMVLMDLGSALMSVEAAIEFLDPGRQPNVYLCEASLVEGWLAAAVAAAGGTIDFVIAAAREALADKTAQLSVLRIPPARRGEPDKAPLKRRIHSESPHPGINHHVAQPAGAAPGRQPVGEYAGSLCRRR